MLKKILATLAAIVAISAPLSIAHAQQMARVVASCGGLSLHSGTPSVLYIDVTGNLCGSGGGGGSGGTSSNFGAAFPTAGTAAGFEYLSSPPTLTNAQMYPALLDVNGNLKVTGGTVQAANSVAINISTAVTTQLVALSGSTTIYVTAWDVIANGTTNFTLEYGTGSLCGSGTTALTGPYGLTAANGIAKGSGIGPVLIVPAGNALCAVNSAAIQVSGSLAYLQQ